MSDRNSRPAANCRYQNATFHLIPRRPAESWRRSFYALLVAQWISIVGFSIVLPFIPFFIRELGVTDPQRVRLWAGVLTTVMALSMAVASPLWGGLADRYGRRLMVQRAMFAGVLIMGAMGLSRDVHDLLILRILQGVFTGTITASVALAAVISPRHLLARSLGLMQTAVFAGFALGPLLGGALADRLGFRPVFIITGGILLIGGLIVTLFVEERFTPSPVTMLDIAGFWRAIRTLAATPALLALNLLLFTVQGAHLSVEPILPLFVQSITGQQAEVATLAGLVLGATASSSALAATFVHRFTARWGYQRVLFWSALGAAALAIPQAFVSTTLQLTLLRVGQGAFIGSFVPTANALIGILTPPERRGSAFGLAASATALGIAVGPSIGAVIGAFVDLRAVFIFTGLVLVVVGVGVGRTSHLLRR